tara:strand:+ start:146 stop:808 length:663 start_codon:yes stop_codon:yes gene_type:complete
MGGALTTGSSYDAYGTWRVENDEICIVVRGGDLRFQSPYEGCFAVLVNPSEGIVAGKFPDRPELIVIKEDVADEIAELVQPVSSPKVVAQEAQPQAAQEPQPKIVQEPRPQIVEKPANTRSAAAQTAPQAPKPSGAQQPPSLTPRKVAEEERRAEVARKKADKAEVNQQKRLELSRRAQEALQVLGMYSGALDGVIGVKTRAAIKRWQERNGHTGTGEIT